jgi:hypothetical protein
MNTAIAREIAAKSAQLVALTAEFEATYGKNYTLKPGSPQDAWDLYDAVFQTESSLASLLDSAALLNPHHRYGKWWDRVETMETAIAQQLMLEARHLIARCAHHHVNQPDSDWSYAIQTAQCAIAGMMRPASLQLALDSASQSAAS